MEIADIKQHLTIYQVLEHYGLKADRSHKLRCPFHEDKTPSMQVYTKTNTAYCFSANCATHGKSMDVIDFIMHKENLNKHEAIQRAITLCPVIEEIPTATPSLTRIAILAKATFDLSANLSKTPKAKEYLKGRSLNPDTLQAGYIGETYGRQASEPLQKSLEQTGLLKKQKDGQYAPIFKYCVTFFLKNKENQTVSLYGRSILTGSETARHFYLKDRQGLYPAYPKAETQTLILTEAIIDAATLITHYPLNKETSVLSLYGTNGFTPEHGQAIKALKNLKEIILFFDGDPAGRAATESIMALLTALPVSCTLSAVDTPDGEDINSLAVNHPGEETALLTHLIHTRKTLTPTKEEEKNPTPVLPDTTPPVHNTENPEYLIYHFPPLILTILGGLKLHSLDRMRITLKIETREHTTNSSHTIRHNLDLYHYQQTEQLITKLTDTFSLPASQAAQILSRLTGELEQYREKRLQAIKPKKETPYQMTDKEKQEALAFLKTENLLTETSTLIRSSGMIGETTNALIALLTYTSRKRSSPLHIMSLGASGSGKTYLQEKVSSLIPEEDKIEITTLSENAFYYFGREELRHKLILIEDLDGAESVLYPLRELQSKNKISKTVTLKDNKGNLKTVTLIVEGPVSISSCTTREKIYEDNANRCLLLYIDQSKEQDARIIHYQQTQSAGKTDKIKEQEAKTLLKNAQRLLKPIEIINPFAPYITLPQEVFRPRRTMQLLLSFIETITYYHQYQRTLTQDTTPAIHTTIQDIEQAFILLKDTLFRKSDELSGGCRNFYEQLQQQVKEKTFYSKDIRKTFRMNPHNLKHYLKELHSYSYIKIAAGNPYRGYEYQINEENTAKHLRDSIETQLQHIITKIKTVDKEITVANKPLLATQPKEDQVLRASG